MQHNLTCLTQFPISSILACRGVPIIGSAKISATDIANSLISVIGRFTSSIPILARAQLLLFLMPFTTLCIVKFALLHFNFDNCLVQLLNVVADVVFFMWWIQSWIAFTIRSVVFGTD